MKFTCGNIQNWIPIVTEFLCRMRPPWPGFRLLSQETKAEIRLSMNWQRSIKMIRAILSVFCSLPCNRISFPAFGRDAEPRLTSGCKKEEANLGDSPRDLNAVQMPYCIRANTSISLTLEASFSWLLRSRWPSKCNSKHHWKCRWHPS